MLQLFFWFFPPGPEGSSDDIIVWYVRTKEIATLRVLMAIQAERGSWRFLTGGSATRERRESNMRDNTPLHSLPALSFQPFSWAWGQAKPTQNEYSWTNLSSVIWIDQPIGTGFSQGDSEVHVCNASHSDPRYSAG